METLDFKRVVIIANGDLKTPGFYRKMLREDDYIICADGGTDHAKTLGLIPHSIIGDLDSVDSELINSISAGKTEVIKYPAEKDQSDLELAVAYAVKLKPAEIVIVGALGGCRFDHSIFNLMLLKLPLVAGIPARIIDHCQDLFMLQGETAQDKIRLEGQPGDYVSLFPLTDKVEGINTEGLKYGLNNGSLFFSSSRGLSNELISDYFSVSISRGMLIVIKTRNS